MDELIKERMEECALGGKGDGSGPSDLLTNLIKASSEDAGSQLTPSEIRGYVTRPHSQSLVPVN
jgi:hypothetical protein